MCLRRTRFCNAKIVTSLRLGATAAVLIRQCPLRQSKADLGAKIIDARFSPVSRHSRDQIDVVTNGLLQAWLQVRYPLVRRGGYAARMAPKAQQGEKGLSVKPGR
jgi:hypothetical protein